MMIDPTGKRAGRDARATTHCGGDGLSFHSEREAHAAGAVGGLEARDSALFHPVGVHIRPIDVHSDQDDVHIYQDDVHIDQDDDRIDLTPGCACFAGLCV